MRRKIDTDQFIDELNEVNCNYEALATRKNITKQAIHDLKKNRGIKIKKIAYLPNK